MTWADLNQTWDDRDLTTKWQMSTTDLFQNELKWLSNGQTTHVLTQDWLCFDFSKRRFLVNRGQISCKYPYFSQNDYPMTVSDHQLTTSRLNLTFPFLLSFTSFTRRILRPGSGQRYLMIFPQRSGYTHLICWLILCRQYPHACLPCVVLSLSTITVKWRVATRVKPVRITVSFLPPANATWRTFWTSYLRWVHLNVNGHPQKVILPQPCFPF